MANKLGREGNKHALDGHADLIRRRGGGRAADGCLAFVFQIAFVLDLCLAVDSVLSWADVSVAVSFSLYFNTAATCAPLYLTWSVEQYSTNRRGCSSMNTNVLPNLHHIRQKLEEMKYLNNNGSVKDHEKPGVGNPFPQSFDNNNIQNKCNSSMPLLQQGSAPSHMSVDDAADPFEIVESSQQVDLREFLEQLG
ncbi:hypothetical protein KI387_037189, partial [Taxus chinensis]